MPPPPPPPPGPPGQPPVYGAPPPPGYGAPGAMPPPPMGYASAGPRFAGFWIRFVAVIIDGILVGLIAGAVAFPILKAADITCYLDPVTGSATNCTVGNPGLAALAYAIWVGTPLLYQAILWGMGGTLGQRALSMRVVDATSGQKIGVFRGFLRLIGYVIATIPFALGLMWAGFDPRKQGWHDKIASTVVLKG